MRDTTLLTVSNSLFLRVLNLQFDQKQRRKKYQILLFKRDSSINTIVKFKSTLLFL